MVRLRSGMDKNKKEMLDSLLILKNKLQKERVKLRKDDDIKTPWVEQKMDDILFRLREMEKKIEAVKRDRIHEFLEYEKLATRSRQIDGDSIRTMKVKGMIKSLLGEHSKLTSAQLSNLINLSRTRCSEYLIDMERRGTVKGTTVRRQKFYEIVNR
jgi:predicted transcriptional regulator